MTPIEIIQGRYGAKILTGVTETDISSLNVVAIVARSVGATFAKLEVDDVDVVSDRGLSGVSLDNTDLPLMAGRNISNRTNKKFTLVKLTNTNDSIWLIFGK